jgi:hypothetical protein
MDCGLLHKDEFHNLDLKRNSVRIVNTRRSYMQNFSHKYKINKQCERSRQRTGDNIKIGVIKRDMIVWTESHRHRTGFNNKFCGCDNKILFFIKEGRSWLSKGLFQGRTSAMELIR